MNYRKVSDYMRKRKIVLCLMLSAVLVLAGCQKNAESNTSAKAVTEDSGEQEAALDVPAKVVKITGDYSDKAIAAEWSLEGSTQISFDQDKISIEGEGANEENDIVSITKAGTYVLSGTLTDGQVIVNLEEDENVQLVLNGVSLNCSNQSPLVIESVKNLYLTLADGTQNSVTDGSEYVYADEDSDEPDAAIFSKDDLIINGTGSLNVTANYNDGIKSKDDLQIISGTVTVTAEGDGMVGKDSVSIRNGNITINAKKDGIKSSGDSDPSKGFVVIDGGIFDITAGTDGIQAITMLDINSGTFNIVTNEGSANASHTENGAMNENWGGGKDGMQPPSGDIQRPSDENADGSDSMDGTQSGRPGRGERPQLSNGEESGDKAPGKEAAASGEASDASGDEATDVAASAMTTKENETSSAKALKSDYNIGIFGGTFMIDSSDDSIHSNQSILIEAGNFTLSSGDDGIHADTCLEISGGSITISKSYEGLESQDITINDGTIELVAADDGINISGGSDGSSENGRPGQNQTTSGSTGVLTINGGTITVDASGDGLDANGSIVMSGGYVTVHGPSGNGNGALDYDETFEISGGVLLAAGSTGMAMTPSEDSEQLSIAAGFDSTIAAGTEVTVSDESGDVLYSFTPNKEFGMVEVSAPEFAEGKSYTIKAGDQTVSLKAGEISNLQTEGAMRGGR